MVNFNLPNFEDPQRRIISGILTNNNESIYIVSAYIPNGQAVDSDKFIYKMNWLNKFSEWVEKLTKKYDEIIILFVTFMKF